MSEIKDNNAVCLQNVCASYGKKMVVNKASFSVPEGKTFGLIGLNGAGKTTLIKSILGLRSIQSGKILVAGRNAGSKEAKRQIAYLPERFNPPSFLTGLEFLKFTTSLYNVKHSKADFVAAAQTIELDEEDLTKRIGAYSKGMRQKLGLLGTFMGDCKIFILDEPMSGLDPAARSATKKLLSIARDRGQSVLLSSHILSDMDEICDVVAVLHNNEIKFEGAPQDLKSKGNSDILETAFLNYINYNVNVDDKVA